MQHHKENADLNQPQDSTVVQFPTTTKPYEKEAEQSVLGGLMLDDQAWPKISNIITTTDFFEKRHRLLWTAISNVIADGAHPDIITVADQLEKDGNLKTVNGNDGYLGLLAGNTIQYQN